MVSLDVVTADKNFDNPEILAEAVERFLVDDTSRSDPFGMFAVLHQTAPVYQAPNGLWLVTGYDALTKLMRDPRLSRWEAAQTELGHDDTVDPELREAISANIRMLVNRDEPDHTRLRKLIRVAFLPSSIMAWKERVQEAAKAIVDKVVDKPRFDLLKEVAFPLPEIVICEMLGVPHADHALWSQWSHDSVAANRTPAPTGDNLIRVQQATIAFHNYFKKLIAERRQNLGDDLISVLLRAEEEGDKLTEAELIGTITLLIQAGHETTANLIGNGMWHLMNDPERYKALTEDASLIPTAVEELLRLDPPSMFVMPRLALEDIEIGDVTIAAGERVLFCPLAANRDPALFPEPDKIDFSRPNLFKHIAFGVGMHVCIGRQLALMEAEVMFREIMARLPKLSIAAPPHHSPAFTRGLTGLQVHNGNVA